MKVAIIGAGASGLACAVESAKAKGTEITVYEAKERVGKKILATGNGRCNMLNMNATAADYNEAAFARGVLCRIDPGSNIDFFSCLGLYTREDDEGRVYPMSNQASSVLDALRFECENLGVRFICGCEITHIKKKGNAFILSDNKVYDKVVLACGGKAGCKNFGGYALLEALGHTVTELSPALTKITVREASVTKQLKGIRHKAVLRLKVGSDVISSEKGELLFTDYGLSGIAVMQLSSLIARQGVKAKKPPVISCDFVADMSFYELCQSIERIAQHNKMLKNENLLSGFMPKKLGEVIVKTSAVPLSQTAGSLSQADIKKIASTCKAMSFEVTGLRGFEDAQVTSGGVNVGEFDKYTLESLICKNLYCCGELLNVDGPCGGYNLHWAFSSGRAVGMAICKE